MVFRETVMVLESVTVGPPTVSVKAGREANSDCAYSRENKIAPMRCYNGVTVLSQWFYSCVAVVLQWCYSGVTMV
jgi:hypothetical protein